MVDATEYIIVILLPHIIYALSRLHDLLYMTLQPTNAFYYLASALSRYKIMSISEINLSYSETDPDLLFAQIKAYCEISCATSKAKKFKLAIAHKIPMELR